MKHLRKKARRRQVKHAENGPNVGEVDSARHAAPAYHRIDRGALHLRSEPAEHPRGGSEHAP
jgi:hypothetical protein